MRTAAIDRLRANLKRVELQGLGRNQEATLRCIAVNYRAAVVDAVRLEDKHGVESEEAERYDYRLRGLLELALELRVLTRVQSDRLEAEAIAEVDLHG